MHKEELSLPFAVPDEWSAGRQCVAVLTGGTEAAFIELVEQGSITMQKPVFILASGTSNSLAASLEILSWVQQQCGQGRVLTSADQLQHAEDNLKDKYVVTFSPKMSADDSSGYLRLGVVGEPSDWLIASKVDPEYILSQTGITLVKVPIEEVTSLGEVDPGIKGAERIYERLKELVGKYNLQGLTLRCFDLLSTVKNTGCVALSRLNDEGIPAACEGDIPLLLTMVLAKHKYGRTGFQVNPARIQPDGKMLFAHCTIPLTMTVSHVYDTHFESGIGIGIHGELPEGKYRLMKLSPDLTQLIDEPVTLTANQYEPNLCRTQVWLQGSKKLAQRLLAHPIANHHLLVKA